MKYNTAMLKDIFFGLMLRNEGGEELAADAWAEIEKNYSRKKRYYHNLGHLQAMYNQLLPHQSLVQDWDSILFSLFYHDVVYNVLRKDNEERSATIAMLLLEKINFPPERRLLCYEQIIATKTHAVSRHPDTNLFTDADLSILGQERAVYETYCKQVRKEYAVYPDILYRPGRKKVVQHFLDMERIFKTDTFFSLLEKTARENLQWELTV